MKIITKYLVATVITYISLVVLFLFGLQLFIEFIREFPNLGKGSYGLYQLLFYVLLMMPYDVYQFFPMSSLLGCVIALSLLASHSELIIMRAAGISLVNIAAAIVKATIVLLIIMLLIGELLSPLALRKAARIKTAAISSGQALLTNQGVWLYNDSVFMNINSMSNQGELRGITYYQVGDDSQLTLVTHADSGVDQQGGWVFNHVVQTSFTDTITSRAEFPNYQWPLKFNPNLINTTHVDSDQKSLVELRSDIKQLLQGGFAATDYQFAFWQRVFAPLATLVIILLAIPFVFGPLRSTTMGLRMLLGVMVGFGFHILNQFVGPMSVVYQFPPLLAAMLPPLIFTIIGGILLFKVRN